MRLSMLAERFAHGSDIGQGLDSQLLSYLKGSKPDGATRHAFDIEIKGHTLPIIIRYWQAHTAISNDNEHLYRATGGFDYVDKSIKLDIPTGFIPANICRILRHEARHALDCIRNPRFHDKPVRRTGLMRDYYGDEREIFARLGDWEEMIGDLRNDEEWPLLRSIIINIIKLPVKHLEKWLDKHDTGVEKISSALSDNGLEPSSYSYFIRSCQPLIRMLALAENDQRQRIQRVIGRALA